MELSIQETQIKHLFKLALIEVLTERRDIFVEIFREAMEDDLLGKAIEEGLRHDPVSREAVFKAFDKAR